MDAFRLFSKFRAGLCVVWLSMTISVPCVRAWADEPLLINPTPLGGINLGGASPEGAPDGKLQVDDDTLAPKYTPDLNTGGMDTGRVDDDTLAPKYTPDLNTGGMDTDRVDDDTLAPKFTPDLNTGGMDTDRVDDDTLLPKFTPDLNTGGMDTGRGDDDTMAPEYTPGFNTGGMDTSASMPSAGGEGQLSSFGKRDPLGIKPVIEKLLGGG